MNLNGKLKKILAAGTTKQKAITYCFEVLDEELDPTDKMAAEILNSIPEKERSTFFKWIFYYNVYLFMTPYFGLAFAEHRAEAFKVVEMLHRVEQLRNEERRSNDMIQAVDEDQRSRLIEIATDNRRDGTVRKEEPDGYVTISNDKLLKEILNTIDTYKFTLSGFKSVVEALEEWAAINKCADAQPPGQVASIDEIKKGYVDEIPGFSKVVLRKREQRGEKITDQERADAIVPGYDEVPSNIVLKKIVADKIKYYERTIRRDAIWKIALKEVKEKKAKEKNKK